MSDDSSTAIRDRRVDWVGAHREVYLRSGGAQGHIQDLTPVGGRPYGANCLIRYRGRKSGKVYVTPLCYGIVGGEIAIIASKGGADHHPDWYLNLIAAPAVDVQVATQAWRANWREPEGTERQKAWEHMVDCFPFYRDYQAGTARVIPVVLMKTGEPIAVFREDDA